MNDEKLTLNSSLLIYNIGKEHSRADAKCRDGQINVSLAVWQRVAELLPTLCLFPKKNGEKK